MSRKIRIPIIELLPDFAGELQCLLRDMGHERLADDIMSLQVRGRCRCGEPFCSTIYVGNDADGKDSVIDHIEFEAGGGLVIITTLDGKPTEIEVLDRDDVHELVQKKMP